MRGETRLGLRESGGGEQRNLKGLCTWVGKGDVWLLGAECPNGGTGGEVGKVCVSDCLCVCHAVNASSWKRQLSTTGLYQHVVNKDVATN